MAHQNKLIIPRKAKLWVVQETAAGTLVYPAAANGVVLAGDASLNQQPSYTDSPEVADSRSLQAQAQDVTPAGSWSFPTLVRPSGTAGTAPAEDALMEALAGAKTVNAGSSVVYTLATELPTVSIWLQEDNVVRFLRGATISDLAIASAEKGFTQLTWSGGFMELGVVAEDELAEATEGDPTPDTSIVVTDSYKFTVGGRIAVGDEDNSGAGFTITDINHSTHTLTVSPGVPADLPIGTAVTPVMPSHTVVGSPLEARAGTVTVGGASKNYSAFNATLTNSNEYVEDEVTTTGYPTDFAEGDRRLTGNYEALFRTNEAGLFRRALAGYTPSLLFQVGTVAGSRFKLSLPKARIQVPEARAQRPANRLTIPFTALRNAANEDEVVFTYD